MMMMMMMTMMRSEHLMKHNHDLVYAIIHNMLAKVEAIFFRSLLFAHEFKLYLVLLVQETV